MAKPRYESFIRPEQAAFIKEFDIKEPRKPYKHIVTFKKNNMKMTRQDFKEVHDLLSDFLTNLNVNFGLLLTPDGTFVFTEENVKYDPIVVKLSTGVNFHKKVNRAQQELSIVNSALNRVSE